MLLADMGSMAKEMFPEHAAEVDEALPDAPEVEGDEAKPATDEPAATAAASQPTEEEMQASAAKDAEEKAAAEKATADAKAEADKKTAEEAAAKATSPPPRDSDLTDQLAPHTNPKTRKVIEDKNAKIKAARDERDAIIAEREALKKERDDLAEKAKAVVLPKETTDELATLRERIRELDIEKDPAIQSKYDAKITANNNAIVTVLKSQGFGITVDPETKKQTENPTAIANLLRSGLTLKNLSPCIAALEKADLIDEAETVREAVRENVRIARDRGLEIDAWKKDYGARQQQRETVAKAAQEAQAQSFRTTTETVLKADLAALAKDFPVVNPPPAPLGTDTPQVAKAKQTALDAFNVAAKQIEATIKSFDTANVPPDKLADTVARINSSAIQGVVLKTHVLPSVLKELASRADRIKQLEGEIARFKGASNLSRAHATQATATNGEITIPKDGSMSDAMAAFGKAMGVPVNT